MSGKLVWALLFVVGGTSFVVMRKILHIFSKRSSKDAIDRIIKDPSSAKAFAESLDIPYSTRENLTQEQFEKLKDYIESTPLIGRYKTLHVTAIDTDSLLVFTELSFDDFDIDVTGGSSDVSKKAYHNFLLRFDLTNQKLNVFSSLYSDMTEKFQRSNFLQVVFKGE